MRGAGQLQQDENAIANGLDTIARHGGEVVALMRVLHARLQDAQAIGSVAPLMEFLYANMDKAALRVAHVKVANQKNCAHCCNRWVTVFAPEAIHVVKSLGAQRAAAQGAVQASLEQTRGRDIHQRGRMTLACSLLGADAACTVYETRPLTCRTGPSIDV